MQNITEFGQPKINWYRTSIDRKVLSRLMRKSDLFGFIQVFSHVTLLVIMGGVSCVFFNLERYILSFVFFYIYCVFYSFLGWAGAGHELAHRTVFKTRFYNDFFLIIFSVITWNNYVYFKASHARHHKYTVWKGLDGEVKLPQFINYSSWFWMLSFDVAGFYRTIKVIIQNSLGLIEGEWGNRLFSKGSKHRNDLVLFARVILMFHFFIAVIFLYFDRWQFLFIFNLSPFVATWVNKILAQAQHFGMRANADDFRDSCRTVLLGPMLSFLYWQMNYHVEHHMYPGVPFFRLRELNQMLKHDISNPTIGFKGALLEMIEINYQQVKAQKTGCFL